MNFSSHTIDFCAYLAAYLRGRKKLHSWPIMRSINVTCHISRHDLMLPFLELLTIIMHHRKVNFSFYSMVVNTARLIGQSISVFLQSLSPSLSHAHTHALKKYSQSLICLRCQQEDLILFSREKGKKEKRRSNLLFQSIPCSIIGFGYAKDELFVAPKCTCFDKEDVKNKAEKHDSGKTKIMSQIRS